ncbi:MAG: Re/Si-specific NAD(P)(+) transhydrogenase subunit alpha [Planctomycetota bacterium]
MPTVLIPKETVPGETRVAATPETVKRYAKAGLQIEVEAGAGASAGVLDEQYQAAGASIVEALKGWGAADLVFKVQPPTPDEAKRLKKGALLVSVILPIANLETVTALREAGVTTLALDLVPRISRAQSMDVLSSQATVAGYKAVLLGASHLSKLCPLLMTAAGTVPPAKVVVFGAGVAGLMAIATARRLGCVVEATDVRLAAKEQVESLGGRFIDVPGMEDLEDEHGYAKEATPEFLARQREEVAKRVAEADLVITTAQIPGRKAPMLVPEETVRTMQPGAVIVDMAVESGGNCALSQLGEVVEANGVKILGLGNLPATVPLHASELFAKNIHSLAKLFLKEEGKVELDWEDEVLAGSRLTHDGEVHHQPTADALAEHSS